MTSEHTAAVPSGEKAGGSPLFQLDPGLAIWTWITFGVLFFILYKFAWKPILAALASRENRIRESLENAEKIKKEMEQLARRQAEVLSQAEAEGLKIVKREREQAEVLARNIVQQAKEESAGLAAAAKKEIQGETEKARELLRQETVNLSLGIAAKLIGTSLTEAKHRELARKYLEEL